MKVEAESSDACHFLFTHSAHTQTLGKLQVELYVTK